MSLRSDPDKMREYKRIWAKNNRDSQRKYVRKVRRQVIYMIGGKCVNCGCDDYDALEINHKNGDGAYERKQRGRKSWHLDILKGRRSTDDLEIMCRVCNNHHYLVTVKGLTDKWTITYG